MREINFCSGWTCRHDGEAAPGKPVSIPHDAARYEARTATSAGGVNTGWYEGYDYLYEKSFVPEPSWDGKTLLLEFEGVYHNAEVFLNGEKLCYRPYGYTNFYVDLTGKLLKGENTIQVIARNADQPNSRWYSGAGIYRPVKLWVGDAKYIGPNDLRVRTISLSPAKVEIKVKTHGNGSVKAEVWDNGKVIASGVSESDGNVRFELKIPGGLPWHPDTPRLYTCKATFAGDTAETVFGLRTLSWGKDGFKINGSRYILQGACIHHDNGLLGAICDPDAVARRVRLLKENGYNAVRSAHNPCSKTLLEECDRQGMLVMDEYIDHWYIHKTVHDYVDYFYDWWKQDLTDMVEKDYNHPCVVLYSTGNEVGETAQPKGIALAKEMTEFLHSLDDTRPVTCGINIFFNFLTSVGIGQYSDEKAKKEAEKAAKRKAQGKEAAKEKAVGSKFFNDMAGVLGDEFMKRMATLPMCDTATRKAFANMDIAGYNYGIYRYKHDLKKYPDRLILGSETFCNDAYRFREQAKKEPRIVGDFVWAGMDYLGEVMVGSWEYSTYASRFDGGLGWVSAGSGRIDLTGKPLGEALYTRVALEKEKGPYLAVRPVCFSGEKHSPSAWKMTDAMPSWSWRGCEGKTAQVEVYARAAKVALFLNGKKVGEKQAKDDCIFTFKLPYENGKLEAVAYDGSGAECGRTQLVTAEADTQLRIEPEEAKVQQGHLSFIRLRFTDKNGILKPMELKTIKASVSGGELLALGNACPFNLRGYLTDETDTYYGEAMAIVRAGETGAIRITAKSGNLSAKAEVAIVTEGRSQV